VQFRLIKQTCDIILGKHDIDDVDASDGDESIVDKAIRNCDHTKCVNSGPPGFSVER
jgi:hypothetical protein